MIGIIDEDAADKVAFSAAAQPVEGMVQPNSSTVLFIFNQYQDVQTSPIQDVFVGLDLPLGLKAVERIFNEEKGRVSRGEGIALSNNFSSMVKKAKKGLQSNGTVLL